MALLLLLLIPLWGVFSDMTKQTLTAMCGGSVLFQVNVPRNIEINSIFWSYTSKEKSGMLAIVKPDELKVINTRFLNRLNSQEPHFSLKLSNLNEEDNGIYEAKIYTNEETIHRSFKLQVNAKNELDGGQWTGCSVLVIIGLGSLTIFFTAMTEWLCGSE